ncbi:MULTISPECIES: DUF4310 family protein [Fusobacterium]|jgi:uncharacterized protein (TIGR03579 family)|uniref:DUF4310 family protein n=1 Tax=Fusobacterium TaxID=848 RepID=UPI001F286781|nr:MULTISPECIES: DUF4310 family protein [Fusobacterium]MCF2612499.1 DUF4310 family protein [Fusobacterium perfoetens]MDY2980606.1 DUF4310 family protein [Fusobacterium sp.]
MENNKNKFLLADISFPLLVGMACAAIFAGTHMYVVHGVGAFNEIFVVKMLDQGLSGGDYAAAAGFAAGFLIARVLEGPLVGLLDVGGSLMTGVGVGIPALLLASGIEAPVKNFPLALLTGAAIGVIIGIIIIAIRKAMPEGMSAGGTGIMMGAGNATGRFLGPLIILSAIQYNIPAGVGAFLGAALFYKYDRHIAGGAIIGAMLIGGLALFF